MIQTNPVVYNPQAQQLATNATCAKRCSDRFQTRKKDGKDSRQSLQNTVGKLANDQCILLTLFNPAHNIIANKQYYAPDYEYHKPDFKNTNEELFKESLLNKLLQGRAGGNLLQLMEDGLAGGDLYDLMAQGLEGGNLYDQLLEGLNGGTVLNQFLDDLDSKSVEQIFQESFEQMVKSLGAGSLFEQMLEGFNNHEFQTVSLVTDDEIFKDEGGKPDSVAPDSDLADRLRQQQDALHAKLGDDLSNIELSDEQVNELVPQNQTLNLDIESADDIFAQQQALQQSAEQFHQRIADILGITKQEAIQHLQNQLSVNDRFISGSNTESGEKIDTQVIPTIDFDNIPVGSENNIGAIPDGDIQAFINSFDPENLGSFVKNIDPQDMSLLLAQQPDLNISLDDILQLIQETTGNSNLMTGADRIPVE